MAKRKPAKAKKEAKKEAPKAEVADVAEEGDETKESMPPVSDAEHVPAASDPAPAVEEAPVEEAVEEAVEETPAEVAAVPGRPAGAPDAQYVAKEWVNQGDHIYKMNGTGGYRKNQKVKIKIEE